MRARGRALRFAIGALLALALSSAPTAYGAAAGAAGTPGDDQATTRAASAGDARNEQRSDQTGSGDVQNTNETTGGRSSSNTQVNGQRRKSRLNAARDRDCSDFTFQEQAQRFFERHGGSRDNDVDNLDTDGDGVACERLPSEGNTPVGGIDTGAGGTAVAGGGGSPLPFALGGAGLGLVMLLLASSIRRRPTN